jgi:putative ABC transport system permease protein
MRNAGLSRAYPWFEMTQLRSAFRSLLQNPGFTAAALLCLALGIGANTAIFTVVDAVLFRPLPYRDSERLARIYTEFPSYGSSGGFRKFWMSTPELLELRRDLSSWEAIESFTLTGVNLAGGKEPERVTASSVTGGLFPMLGVAPQIGRTIIADDDRPGVALAVIISDGLWKRSFGGDAQVLNRSVKVNGLTANIVGVMPRGFQFPPGENTPPELWMPQQIDPANPGSRSGHFQNALGKLKSGVGIERAREEITRYLRDQDKITTPNFHHFSSEFHTLVALPFHGEITGEVRPAMLVMMGAVGFVLLIACVNVGNLLLARAESRHHEMAVRKAIGASLWHLTRQCLSEGLLLAGLGALLGLGVASAALRLILAFNQGSIPRAIEIGIDWRILVFTLGASILTGVLFGLAPLAQFAGDTHASLKSSTGRTTATAQAHWLRRAMVVSELALALVLLVGAGLMVRTFWKLQQVHIGLDPSRVLTMRLALPQGQYAENADVKQLWGRLLERVRGIPGVQSVTLASGLPPQRPLNANDTMIEGYVKRKGGPDENVDFYQIVSPGYFETMKVPIVEGRPFDLRDGDGGAQTVIINRSMAQAFYGSQSPIGRRIKTNFNGPWRVIVGVAADVKNVGVDKPAGTELYLPYAQADGGQRGMFLTVKAASDPEALIAPIRREIASLDASLPVSLVREMDEVIGAATTRPRFLSVLLTLFSVIALGLAAVGIYGVMAYTVAQRTQEFGIRLAIGASPGNVLSLVLNQGIALGMIGVALGAAGAFFLTRFLKRLLFGIEAFDPLTFAGTAALLTLVILAACYLPARRATKVDPMVALRYE